MSLATLSERTRVRPALIEALERNDFAACGGEVYARGHVRTIARVLGIDADAMLTSMGANNAPTTLETPEPETVNIWELKSRSFRPAESRVWLALIGIGALIVGTLMWFGWQNRPQQELAPEALLTASATPRISASESATPSTEVTPTESAVPEESQTGVATGALVITLDAAGSSWVRVSNGKGTLYEGTLRKGGRRVVSSDSDVTVRIGNAEAVAISVNGEDQGVLGSTGEVVTRTFTVAGSGN